MKNHIWLAHIIIILFVTVACTPSPELHNESFLKDTSLVSGEPCLAPCWQNLIPGETIWDDAVDLLANNADISNLDRTRFRETGEEIYNFAYQEGPDCCRIYSRDGEVLSSLALLLAPDSMLEAVIAQYGEPQFLAAEDKTDDQTIVSLVFSDVPMIVYVFATGISSGEISADSEVIGVVYMAESEMELFLADTELVVWEGYGPLDEMVSQDAN